MSHGLIRTHWEPGQPPEIHHMDQPTAYSAAKFGTWLFLATELLLFGGLFATFFLFHWMYPTEFHHAAAKLDRVIGGVNTLVLLASSLTAALAVDAVQHNDNKRLVRNLALTLLGAVIFLVIKAFEWHHKYETGLFPGTEAFNNAEQNQSYKMFFGLYYCLTGLHALHVIIGGIYLGWVLYYARLGRFSKKYYVPVENGALYWHLVDLIWIYLFPLLYLIG